MGGDGALVLDTRIVMFPFWTASQLCFGFLIASRNLDPVLPRSHDTSCSQRVLIIGKARVSIQVGFPFVDANKVCNGSYLISFLDLWANLLRSSLSYCTFKMRLEVRYVKSVGRL